MGFRHFMQALEHCEEGSRIEPKQSFWLVCEQTYVNQMKKNIYELRLMVESVSSQIQSVDCHNDGD